MQCRFFFAVFISFQCFICAVIFHRVIFVCSLCRYICDFVSFVKVFNMQLQGVLGIFQQRSCAEMQCRCLCSFHQFSMFYLRSNLSPCNFCLLVVQLLLRFCFFRKNFKYAVARCVGYFSTTFLCRNAMSVFSLQFSSVFNVLFEQKSFTVYFVCWLCSCYCDFVLCGSSCVFVCKLSGRLSEKVPRLGSLLVSTVFLV